MVMSLTTLAAKNILMPFWDGLTYVTEKLSLR